PADVHDTVGKLERLEDLLGVRRDELVEALRLLFIALADDDLLHLVELMDAIEPARVASGRSGLAAIARRHARVELRKLCFVEDLAAVIRGDRDLRRPDEKELVALACVGLLLPAGKVRGAFERLASNEGRDDHRHEALLDELHDRVPEHGELEERAIALEDVHARSRELRRARDVDDVELLAELEMIAELEVRLRRLAPASDLDVVVRRQPIRDI